jgi:hypothetical protein
LVCVRWWIWSCSRPPRSTCATVGAKPTSRTGWPRSTSGSPWPGAFDGALGRRALRSPVRRGPPTPRPPRTGPEHARRERRQWGRHLLAWRRRALLWARRVGGRPGRDRALMGIAKGGRSCSRRLPLVVQLHPWPRKKPENWWSSRSLYRRSTLSTLRGSYPSLTQRQSLVLGPTALVITIEPVCRSRND